MITNDSTLGFVTLAAACIIDAGHSFLRSGDTSTVGRAGLRGLASFAKEPKEQKDGIAYFDEASVIRVSGFRALRLGPLKKKVAESIDHIRQLHLAAAVGISTPEDQSRRVGKKPHRGPHQFCGTPRAKETERRNRLGVGVEPKVVLCSPP